MSTANQKEITVFYVLSIIALSGLLISSIVMINQNSMNARLQGWVNLLWLPLPLVILIIDRILVRKFGVKRVNKTEGYILATLIILFIINVIRLQFQN